MAQVKLRNNGSPLPVQLNVRLALGNLSSDEAYDDRFTDFASNTAWPNPLDSNKGYTLYVNDRNVRDEYEMVKVWIPNFNNDVEIEVPKKPPIGKESGFLHVEGRNFVTEQGQPWQFRGYSSHYLQNCFVGGYPTHFINDVLDQINEYGYNTIISIGHHNSPWKQANGWAYGPHTDPNYFHNLGKLLDLCADKKIRVAHAIMADMQFATFDPQWFFRESCAVLAGRWNVLARKGNENKHNGYDPRNFAYPNMGGVLCSQGSHGDQVNPYTPYLDFCEFEVKRSLPKMFLDLPLRQMMDGDFAGPATNRPTINIEPMYFADTNPDHVGDNRSTDPRVALESGIMMAACAGGGFGCSLGLECKVLAPGSISDQCAREFIRGLKAGFVRPLAALDFQGDS